MGNQKKSLSKSSETEEIVSVDEHIRKDTENELKQLFNQLFTDEIIRSNHEIRDTVFNMPDSIKDDLEGAIRKIRTGLSDASEEIRDAVGEIGGQTEKKIALLQENLDEQKHSLIEAFQKIFADNRLIEEKIENSSNGIVQSINEKQDNLSVMIQQLSTQNDVLRKRLKITNIVLTVTLIFTGLSAVLGVLHLILT